MAAGFELPHPQMPNQSHARQQDRCPLLYKEIDSVAGRKMRNFLGQTLFICNWMTFRSSAGEARRLYLGTMLNFTASADTIATESGCCETQSTGVSNMRSWVIAGRAPARHWASSALK